RYVEGVSRCPTWHVLNSERRDQLRPAPILPAKRAESGLARRSGFAPCIHPIAWGISPVSLSSPCGWKLSNGLQVGTAWNPFVSNLIGERTPAGKRTAIQVCTARSRRL